MQEVGSTSVLLRAYGFEIEIEIGIHFFVYTHISTRP